ncbi:MAG: T9SS type A sorting domain-containing protein, partial [Bacteroidales bacterium]|nr:T9SS type A sorting domain-containing protein [Bacteroidales bacterium]
SNRTVIANAWHISNLLNYTGTYYLAVLAHENYFCTTFLNTVHTDTNVVLYVDGVNGDDSQDGLSPATALATLDTALERSNGVGTYYLTEDYTFANYAPLYFYYAKVYPYQKDIHLKIGTSCQNDVALIPGKLIFGERGSNYYFLLDSNRADNYYDFLDADYGGSYLEVNNLKVRNTYFPSLVFWGDQVVLRNCEFINDSVEYSLFGLETKNGNSIKFINCTISNSYFMDGLNYIEYDSASITFENTIVSDNVFGWGFYCVRGGIVNLTSGNWRNNNLLDNFYYSDNPNLSTQNCAGIWIYRCNVYMGADFSIDTNNYICIDSLSTINITDNFTAPMVAQIYPMKWDDSYGKYLSDYYEGRPLLSGSASLLRANYQKYGVAQTDTIAIWYLHSDGKIYTTEEPVGIAQAENSDIRIYPNPAADKVTIDLQNTAATEICVMDIYGKTVVRKAVNGQSETIDLADLANGMYFVQIRNNSKVKATQKLVKR